MHTDHPRPRWQIWKLISLRAWMHALRWVRHRRKRVTATLVLLMHVIGALTSVRAIMETRTPQGSIAWAISLNTFPYVAVPAYWVFGASRFEGYEQFRPESWAEMTEVEQAAVIRFAQKEVLIEPTTPEDQTQALLLENLVALPFTKGNRAELLIDGEQTFDAIFQGVAAAQDYVLVQFYILRDDGLGQRLKQAMIERANNGVRVFVQYDEHGSRQLSRAFKEELREAGVEIEPFNTTRGQGNRFRLNFRNHRKVVVVDGRLAFVGGHNVGDEYLGKHPTLTPWRDTHVALRGPVVQSVQLSFVEDWHFGTSDIIQGLNWEPDSDQGPTVALCLPTGPADKFETATLFFVHAINSAKQRLWIVSPYFVPDETLMTALKLAALRGVDVRVLLPETPDSTLVYLSSFSYLEPAERAGIQIYRYLPGFLHQKVMLVDDRVSVIGTANFDNRSMRLNFEISIVLVDTEFAGQVESMLEADFAASRQASASEYLDSSIFFRLPVKISRLLAPIQ